MLTSRGGLRSFSITALMLIVFLRSVGDSIESVVLPWSVLENMGLMLGVAGIFAVQDLPWIAMPMAIGLLIDRARRKNVVTAIALSSQIAMLVSIAFLGSEMLKGPSILLFYGAILIIAFADNLVRYFAMVTIPLIVGSEASELQHANSLVGIAERVARAMGFAIAGPLAMFMGLKSLIIDAVLLAVAIPLVLMLKTENKDRVTHVGTSRSRVENRRNRLSRLPSFVAVLMVAAALFNFAIGSWRIVVLDTAQRLGDSGALLYSYTNLALAVYGIAGTSLILKLCRRVEIERFLQIGLFIETLFVALLALLYLVPLSMLLVTSIGLIALIGLGDPLINVSLDTVFQKRIELGALGRIRGLFDAVATLSITASGLITAWLIDTLVHHVYIPLTYTVLAILGTALAIHALTNRSQEHNLEHNSSNGYKR